MSYTIGTAHNVLWRGSVQVSKWQTLFLMSLVIPIGVLTGFKVSGLSPHPLTPETILIDAVRESMIRPGGSVFSGLPNLINLYDDQSAFFCNLSVNAGIYMENYQGPPSNGGDYFPLQIACHASVNDGYIYSMTIGAHKTDMNATIAFQQLIPPCIVLNNLEDHGFHYDGTWPGRNARFITSALGEPKVCSISKVVIYWWFNDKNDVTHNLEVSLETIYFLNGSFFNATVPVELEVRAA